MFIIWFVLTACDSTPSSPTPFLMATPSIAPTLTPSPSPTFTPDLVIYSGRGEDLVGPLLSLFQIQTGIKVQVFYGTTPEMASTIIEEGAETKADIYYGQDAGALGALAKAKQLAGLPDELLTLVDPKFRSPEGVWVGTSGRARTVIYHAKTVTEADLPTNLFGFCDSKWRGRFGWAPTNASLHASITTMRLLEGDDKTREWLACIQANEPQVYTTNTELVQAIGRGESEVGITNHYYLFRFLDEEPDFPAKNYSLPDGGAGSMVNVAGVGIVKHSAHSVEAEQFVRFLLSETAQHYFNEETHEYPLSADIQLNPLLTPLEQINSPLFNLEDLQDLDKTLQLMQEVGVL